MRGCMDQKCLSQNVIIQNIKENNEGGVPKNKDHKRQVFLADLAGKYLLELLNIRTCKKQMRKRFLEHCIV